MKPWTTRCLATACLGSALALATNTAVSESAAGSIPASLSREPERHSPIQRSGSRGRLPAKARGSVKDESLATRLRREGMVTVGGQVHRPGPVPLTAGTTLSTAIERAGGATVFGSMKRVRLSRGGTSRVFDVTRQEHRGEPLLPNDTILVPEKMILGN
jgi:SLBB domain